MSEGVQLWLVERDYAADRDLVQLTYATIGGEQYLRTEQSAHLKSEGPTASIEVEGSKLSEVPDAETRERYAAEAERVSSEHDADDVV